MLSGTLKIAYINYLITILLEFGEKNILMRRLIAVKLSQPF